MPSPSTPYSSDYWLYAYLYNPLAHHLCFIHPNWITLAATLFLLPVAYSLVQGAPLITVVLLMVARAALDCMDGSVARACHTTSEWGSFFDKLSDMIFLSGLCGSLVYLVASKYGVESWKTLVLLVAGLIIVGSTVQEAFALHKGCATESLSLPYILMHDNFTLICGLGGALSWWLANRF